MRGAIAAGHPSTAEAGADVLRAGGTAVDACIAAAFVSWVCESPLTGPGGGGFMLVHDGGTGETVLLDFFVAVPRRAAGTAELLELAVDFDGDTQQVFRTGPAAVAVPGSALGLWEAHRRFGTMPWADLLRPAITLARTGLTLTETQGYLHAILDPLLRHSPEGDAMYGPGRARAAGERFALPELAGTLERLAAEGPEPLYAGDLADRLVAHVPLDRADLEGYEVVVREPLAASFRGHELRTNPPPSSGGRLIAAGLEALGDGRSVLDVARAMEAQEAARTAGALSGTTHISVVDAHGDAASLSASLGSGSGVVVPGTGIHLNNMLGEADLTRDLRPGGRLTSMMAPSLLLRDGGPRLVVGSAGSARLRGAILQVVANVVGGMGVAEAVDAPRIHLEEGAVHCEDAAAADALERAGYPVVRWRGRNLYFGGVGAVEIGARGELAAAGDPRRGGAGLVVEAAA
jgi:gamma-glutamyltranspeptidase/glutathione hydrolase